jgi:CheY-like chemotaxis protein
MTRRSRAEQPSGYTIMLVDDNADYLQATRLLLERDGHEVLTATNGKEALAVLPAQKVDLLLLDYYMPGMTGEQVVAEIRKVNPYVQVILQTGYASEQPPQDLLRRLDIQGYYDKTEGPEQLLMWTAVGLKAAYTVEVLNKSREGLQQILESTPALHRIQPLPDLLENALHGATRLVTLIGRPGRAQASDPPDGFVALVDHAGALGEMVGTGHFRSARDVEPELLATIDHALDQGELLVSAGATIVPLRVGGVGVGVICLHCSGVVDQALHMLRVFADQAAVAIQNTLLYDLVDVDVGTGLFARSLLEAAVVRAASTALRWCEPLGLVLLGIDEPVSAGELDARLASDAAVAALGAKLRGVIRAGDLAARSGPDELAVLVHHPTAEAMEGLGRRLTALTERPLSTPSGEVTVRSSVGHALLLPHPFPPADAARKMPAAYFVAVRDMLLTRARSALLEARQSGGGARGAGRLSWPALPDVQ